ncbi:MAG: hypothetical protein V1799_09160 [bacterium]
MKTIIGVILLASIFTTIVLANSFMVKSVKGIVEVRRGVTEEWKRVKVGDVLKPEDSMRTGKNASASLIVDQKKMIAVPELSLIDLSDLRQLNQEDFLLKLAMENILSVPAREDQNLTLPNATIIHGTDKSKSDSEQKSDVHVGTMQLHGTKVLFDNAFFATSILKSKETMRKFPELKLDYDSRLLIAVAFEKMKLKNEAIKEYSLLSAEQLPPAKLKAIQESLDRLKAEK